MGKDKEKKKHRSDKNKEKKDKKRKREEAGQLTPNETAEQPTPQSGKKGKERKKNKEDISADPHAGVGDSTAKKKKRVSAAGGDGDHQALQQEHEGQQHEAQHQQEQRQERQHAALGAMPAAPTFDPVRDGDRTLAAFRTVREVPTGPDQLQPCWPLEGAVPTSKRPLAPMDRVLEGKAELWVIQLPSQMEADALDGCVLQVDEGMASHPERAGVMGHLEIAEDAAAEHELVRRFSVRQEGAAAKEQLFVAAPTERSTGALQVLRPAQRLVVAEDIDAVNERLVESVHDAAPALQFYPHACAPQRANAVLQEQGLFKPPPAEPPAGSWPPPSWAPSAALQERDKRRAARRKRGLPEVDPHDDLEQQQLNDLRPRPGALWGTVGGQPLPPQWCAVPGRDVKGWELLGDVEQDVSISYKYA